MAQCSRRQVLQALTAAALLPCLPACATPKPTRVFDPDGGLPALGNYLGEICQDAMAESQLTGLSIALLDDQQVVWGQGLGYADRAAGRGVTVETRFRAGSISKLFTTLAALQLAEAGRLDLDAPLRKVVPEFHLADCGEDWADAAVEITPRMLMTHHSGLPTDHIDGFWASKPMPFQSLLPILAQTCPAFVPNQVYAYSNLGMTLLGIAVERASGLLFEGYMARHVLAPLGMGASEFAQALPGGERSSRAYGADGKLAGELPLRDMPAGGLNSTVVDLLQLARLVFAEGKLDGHRLLSEAGIKEMIRPQNQDCLLDADLRVALGWHVAAPMVPGSGAVLFHSGATLNHHSLLMLLPEHKIAVALLCNSAGSGDVLEALATKALKGLLEIKAGLRAAVANLHLRLNRRYPPVTSDRYLGYFDTAMGLIKVTRDAGKLVVTMGEQDFNFQRREDGYYVLTRQLWGLIPLSLGRLGDCAWARASLAGREVLLLRSGSDFILAGEQLEPVPIPEAWAARQGRYVYVGTDPWLKAQLSSALLTMRDGLLLVETSGDEGINSMALTPLGNYRARVRGLGRGRGDVWQVVRDSQGEAILVAGMLFRRV